MIIFKDVFSGDELISDVYGLKEVDGIAYEADCSMIEISAVEVDTGANASAEEASDALDDGPTKVNNVLHSFRLQSIEYDAKGYKSHIAGYFKKLLAKVQESGASEAEVKEFKTKAQAMIQKIMKNFKDYECYVGESLDVDNGMLILLNYREDGVTPYCTFWKHGLKEEKV